MKKAQPSAGNVLIVTVTTLAVVGSLIGLALEYTTNVSRNVQRSFLLRQAVSIGDSATELAFTQWRALCRAQPSTNLTASAFTAIPTPSPGVFPGVPRYTLTNVTVAPVDVTWQPMATGAPPAIAGMAPNETSNYYRATADVIIPTVSSKRPTDPTDNGNVIAKVRRIFQKETVSLWRYALFFNDDLEIHPGQPMVVTGEVHTNGSLFTATDNLQLNGKTTFTNSWEVDFKPGDSRRGVTRPASPTWPADLEPGRSQLEQPYGVTMADYHELVESTKVAKTPVLDPAMSASRFETQAGIQIYIDGSNAVTIYQNGSRITSGETYDAVRGAVSPGLSTSNGIITDNREGLGTGTATVRLATLDVGKITDAVEGGDLGSFNGMIYILDTSATGKDLNNNGYGPTPNTTLKRGIRLKNGGRLPSTGLTVVSGNPVYIQGDYNTGTYSSGSNQPASNVLPPDPNNPPSPTANYYTRQAAAVIADAVTILSNSWNDALSASNPTASSTTVNAGIISGNVPTKGGSYSGGVENFPRFLENWNAKNFTYYGSMIQLYKSQQSIGAWNGTVYGVPNRAWFFDTKFLVNPPPGLLTTINYRRARWYME